jgi:transposase
MPDGRALTGFAHEYKRHGTPNLFAALEVAAGRAVPRKRRDEFLRFLDRLVVENPGQELHLVLDNLSVPKLREDHPWRVRHPQVHILFTPTHAPWINQIEAWFSILSRSVLKGASFRNVRQLMDAIEKFVAAYNQSTMLFEWTKVRVSPKTPRSKCADLVK